MEKFTVLRPDFVSVVSLLGSGFCFRSRGCVSLSWLFGLVQLVLLELLEGGLWHVSSFVGCFRGVLLLQELRHVILLGSVIILISVRHNFEIDICAAFHERVEDWFCFSSSSRCTT